MFYVKNIVCRTKHIVYNILYIWCTRCCVFTSFTHHTVNIHNTFYILQCMYYNNFKIIKMST